MSFSVAPKNSAPIAESTPQADSPRERAIAKLLQSSAPQQQAPVQNPTQISPEEASVVLPKSDNGGQLDTVEASSDAPTEPPKEATPAKPESTEQKSEEPLSSQYAVLARKEKALRAKAQARDAEFKQREAALLSREEAIKAKESEYKTNYIPKNRLSQDPMSTLLEAGITYDQITQLALNPPQQMDPATKALLEEMRTEIKSLKGEQESVKQSYADQQKKAYDQAVNQIRSEAKSLIQSDPDGFETIRETGSVDDVVELITKTFDQDGILLSVEEAAKAVEDHLLEEAYKITRIKKIQQKLKSETPEPAKKQEDPNKQQQLKTLTNAVSTPRKLSARERAMLAFEGKLK